MSDNVKNASGRWCSGYTITHFLRMICLPLRILVMMVAIGRVHNTYCPSGQKVGSDDKTCEDCPENTRSDGGTINSCPQCPAGTRTYNNPDGTKSNECIDCPAGQFGASAGAGCSTCPANTYSGRTGATSCTPCPAGKFSLSGANSCSPCPPGKYSSSGAGCSVCPLNTYSSVSIFLGLDVLCVHPTLTAQ